MTNSKMILSASIIFLTPVAAIADNLPRIDFEKVCRSRAQALGQLDEKTVRQTLESCMRAERDAQSALTAAWQSIPANYKSQCIKPKDYSPSYGEWIACLELLIDIKKVRSQSNN